MKRIKKYNTEEERKAARRESQRKWAEKNKEKIAEWRLSNKEHIAEYNAEYRQANKERLAKRLLEWLKTKKGRASHLINSYKRNDKKYNRGECTLTPEWIIEHIFTQPCAHCGETDWRELGCNRLDNSLPHTPDNVEPCCLKCNLKLEGKEKSKPVYQYTLDGELVKVWKSTLECGKNGFIQTNISACCLGKRKTANGYRWTYEPL